MYKFYQVIAIFAIIWKWLKKRPRNVMIFITTLIVLAVGAVFFFKHVFPLLALAALAVFMFSEGRRIASPQLPMPTLQNDEVCWEVIQFMFETLSELGSVLSDFIRQPLKVHDIYDPLYYRSMFRGVPILLLHLLRKKGLSYDDAIYIRDVIQSAVNTRIAAGHLSFVWAVPASSCVPLLKIVAVENAGIYMSIKVILTNSQAGIGAALFSDRPKTPPSVDSTDPLFPADT